MTAETQAITRKSNGGTRRHAVLVTAAGGHQGKLLIPKLVSAGFVVRAVRATAGKEEEVLKLGASEVIVADISDVAAYEEAMTDMDTVYHVGPGAHLREYQMGVALVKAARVAGVRHVVLSSVLHPIIDILQHRIKRDLEEMLIESDLNFTILKPCDFMMPEQYSLPAFATGTFPAFWSLAKPRRGSLIDLDDLTDVAAKVIREGEAHYFASYELSGPDKLTARDVAAILSRVSGRDVVPVEWRPEDMLEHMFGAEADSPEARHHLAVISSVSNWYGNHDFIGNPNVLQWLLGRPPTCFQQFAEKAFREFSRASASRGPSVQLETESELTCNPDYGEKT